MFLKIVILFNLDSPIKREVMKIIRTILNVAESMSCLFQIEIDWIRLTNLKGIPTFCPFIFRHKSDLSQMFYSTGFRGYKCCAITISNSIRFGLGLKSKKTSKLTPSAFSSTDEATSYCQWGKLASDIAILACICVLAACILARYHFLHMYVLGNLTLLSGSDASLCAAVITVAVNVLSTVKYIHSVDRVGCRMLLLETGIQMFLSRAVIRVIYTRN